MASIAEIRAALAAKQNKGKSGGKKRSGGDGANYPFWDIGFGETATIRLLPDLDTDNPLFWRNKEVIKLPFDGVVGGEYPTNERVTVTVPCVEMFGMKCPVIAGTRHLWKTDEDLARVYWKKKSFLYQGFVIDSPIQEENVPESPIRRFTFTPMIQKVIEAALANPDIEDNPADYVGGRDFRVKKTKNGDWPDYSTSAWSMKTRSLGDAEMAAIEKYGLADLKTFRGAIPDADGVAMIKAMFEDSFAGKPFDAESYGSAYRAYGANGSFGGRSETSGSEGSVSSKTETAATVTEGAAPSASATAAGPASASSSADVLARIRNRIQK